MVLDDNVWKKFFEQPIDAKTSTYGDGVNTFKMPALSGSILPTKDFNIDEAQKKLNELEKQQRNLTRGSDVLRTVEAHETSHIGEVATSIHSMLHLLRNNAALTHQQWKWLTELTHSINELIGDPDDSGPIDPNGLGSYRA